MEYYSKYNNKENFRQCSINISNTGHKRDVRKLCELYKNGTKSASAEAEAL